jgi:hypothetical protein
LSTELAEKLGDYLVDDAHFNDQGQQARAVLTFNHIEQDLPKELLNWNYHRLLRLFLVAR